MLGNFVAVLIGLRIVVGIVDMGIESRYLAYDVDL